MENAPAIPDTDITYLYNPSTKHYDVVNLKTGALIREAPKAVDPVVYNLQTADLICDMIRGGMTLKEVCKDPTMPTQARFYHWLAIHPELRLRYEQARKQRADAFHDRALELALSLPSKDEVPGVKLAVDTLKWAAEKASPDYYGKQDKVQGGTSISVVLNTGVLDTKGPPDIVIDEFGNFKGYTHEQRDQETFTEESSGTLAKAERWVFKDDYGSGIDETGTGEEATEVQEG